MSLLSHSFVYKTPMKRVIEYRKKKIIFVRRTIAWRHMQYFCLPPQRYRRNAWFHLSFEFPSEIGS